MRESLRVAQLERLIPDFTPGASVQFMPSVFGGEPVRGIVTGILNEGGEWQYRVAWFREGQRNEAWVRPFEIEDVTP